MNKKKLGRGLGELLGDALDDTGRVMEIAVRDISPNPWQPRRDFPKESLTALAESIKENGLIQPVVVRQKKTAPMSWQPAKDAGGRPNWQVLRPFLP